MTMAGSRQQLIRRSSYTHSSHGSTKRYPQSTTSIVGSIRSGVRYTYTTVYGYQRITCVHLYSHDFMSSGAGYSSVSQTRWGWTCVIAITDVPTKATRQTSKHMHRKYGLPVRLTCRSTWAKDVTTDCLIEVRYCIRLQDGTDVRGPSWLR